MLIIRPSPVEVHPLSRNLAGKVDPVSWSQPVPAESKRQGVGAMERRSIALSSYLSCHLVWHGCQRETSRLVHAQNIAEGCFAILSSAGDIYTSRRKR